MSTTVMTLRIPSELHALIREMAKRDDRSFNGLVVVALRRLVEERASETGR